MMRERERERRNKCVSLSARWEGKKDDCVVCVQEFLKSVAEMEGQLDGMEGLGLLLAGGCVTADKEVILKRTSELRLELSLTH